MPLLTVQVSGDRQVLALLGDLSAKLGDMRGPLAAIGERVVEQTKQRFDTLTGPDGQPWLANAQSTLDAFIRKFSGSHKKDGSLSKRGQTRLDGKKPLTGETGALRSTINYQLEGDNTVSIGSPMIYARVQQEGAKQGQFGHGQFASRKGSFAIPWGDIPARPFLGFADQDQQDIVQIVRQYLKPGEN